MASSLCCTSEQARRCLPLLDSFEEEGIDDTDEGDEEACAYGFSSVNLFQRDSAGHCRPERPEGDCEMNKTSN